MELRPREILDTISEIEALAEKLYELLPESIIFETPYLAGGSLIDIRGFVLDIQRARRIASGAILHLRKMLDEQEAET